MKNLLIPFSLLIFIFACSKKGVSLIGSGEQPSTPTPITSKYCTTWVNFRAAPTEPSMSLLCLQGDDWVEDTNTIDETAECGPTKTKHYGHPEIFQDENKELYIGYEKCPGFGEETIMKVKKFSEAEGWSDFNQENIIFNVPATGKPIELYTQFGAKFFSAFGRVYTFWTAEGGTKSYLSYAEENGTWNKITIPETTLLRHPEHFETNDGRHFIYYAQPMPRVFEVTELGIIDRGRITVNPAVEYTVYSSFTMFNNQAVIAYSSDNHIASWPDQVSKIKVAFHQGGTSWLINTDSIIDTPGRDGITPHLFVVDGELYILYPDYTTEGQPTHPYNIKFRFRVKKFDGTNWVRVGAESAPVWLSQRFEYTQEDSKIFFTALTLDSTDPTKLVKRVMYWENDVFSYLGKELSVRGNKAAADHAGRLGNVIIQDI